MTNPHLAALLAMLALGCASPVTTEVAPAPTKEGETPVKMDASAMAPKIANSTTTIMMVDMCCDDDDDVRGDGCETALATGVIVVASTSFVVFVFGDDSHRDGIA